MNDVSTFTAPAADTLVDPAHFAALADALCGDPVAAGLDRVSLSLDAECSDFVRFNQAQVRQATRVRQGSVTVTVVAGGRRVQASTTLSGDRDADIARLRAERDAAIAALAVVPDDPWLLLPEPGRHSHHDSRGRLPTVAELVRTVADAGAAHDLVGFHAAGPVARAFADSTGSRHWHCSDSFHMDWCVYAPGGADPALRDKAVKAAYAGDDWSADVLAGRIAESARRVPLLLRPPHRLQPGPVRAAFSPAAMAELLDTLAWGGFSEREHRLGTSCLSALARPGRDGARLHPQVRIDESLDGGRLPAFTPDGFVRPPQVRLVDGGLAVDRLVGPRTAREHAVAANAGDDEHPQGLALAGGDLPDADLLRSLGTGLYVSQLWYLNFSDRQAARITGMTRFACLWVQDGEPVAPVPVMRFDDSALRLFGDGLLGLTRTPERIPDSGSYGGRRLAATSTPAALVDGLRLTL